MILQTAIQLCTYLSQNFVGLNFSFLTVALLRSGSPVHSTASIYAAGRTHTHRSHW